MLKMTNEDFIKKSKGVHGEKYDYSLVSYINMSTKVKIICKEHGAFEQTPKNHISRRYGCSKCSGKNKTTDDFIIESKQIHGDIYDYSLVEYINCKLKVKIICKEHGIFEQNPSNHLQGKNGCVLCVNEILSVIQKDSLSEFILKSKNVHGLKYDYSLVEYVKSNVKVNIVCKEHGTFYQKPNNHLSGKGCPKCSKVFMDLNYFIQKSKQIHGDKYDYQLVNYVDSHTKVEIICSEHGVFEQAPNSHLNGSGCPKCVGKNKTNEDLIEDFKCVHNDIYDYSLVEYINMTTKVDIICKEHGVFQQNPSNHMNGQGCPKCVGKQIDYLPYKSVIDFVRKLNIKTQKDWRLYCKSGLKPDNIPYHPDRIYKKP